MVGEKFLPSIARRAVLTNANWQLSSDLGEAFLHFLGRGFDRRCIFLANLLPDQRSADDALQSSLRSLIVTLRISRFQDRKKHLLLYVASEDGAVVHDSHHAIQHDGRRLADALSGNCSQGESCA